MSATGSCDSSVLICSAIFLLMCFTARLWIAGRYGAESIASVSSIAAAIAASALAGSSTTRSSAVNGASGTGSLIGSPLLHGVDDSPWHATNINVHSCTDRSHREVSGPMLAPHDEWRWGWRAARWARLLAPPPCQHQRCRATRHDNDHHDDPQH